MNQYLNLQQQLYLKNEDIDFIKYLINEITEDGLLPFSLPPQIFPRLIKNSAIWFYEHCDDAISEKWYYIKKSQIPKSDNSRNTVIKLPKEIQAVWEIKPTSSSNTGASIKFNKEPLLYGAAGGAINSLGGGGGTSVSSYNNSANRDMAVENYFAYMYECQLFKTLLGRSFPFDYSHLTNELILLDNVQDTGLVLKTFTRIPLSALYNLSTFRKHVIGNSFKRLKRILNQFDFQYPGDVKINFEDIESEGKDMISSVEEEVRAESDASDLFLTK